EIAEVKGRRQLAKAVVEEFVFDRVWGHALRRWVRRSDDGAILERVENERFEQVGAKELWLPRRTTWKRFIGPAGVTAEAPRVRGFRVLRVDPERTGVQFTPDETKRGTGVWDYTV